MAVYYIIAVLNILVASIAQMMMKKSASMPHSHWLREYLNFWVIGGYALMFLTLISNIFVMRHGVLLKQTCTIESLNYLFVPLLSYLIFKEPITLRKLAAIALIMGGVVVFFV